MDFSVYDGGVLGECLVLHHWGPSWTENTTLTEYPARVSSVCYLTDINGGVGGFR